MPDPELHPTKGPPEFTLEQLQAAVGGYIELLPTCLHSFSKGKVDLVAVVNEEGLLKELPMNPLATMMLSSLAEPIYGDVLICPTRMVS